MPNVHYNRLINSYIFNYSPIKSWRSSYFWRGREVLVRNFSCSDTFSSLPMSLSLKISGFLTEKSEHTASKKSKKYKDLNNQNYFFVPFAYGLASEEAPFSE